jgi:hypothetical protein
VLIKVPFIFRSVYLRSGDAQLMKSYIFVHYFSCDFQMINLVRSKCLKSVSIRYISVYSPARSPWIELSRRFHASDIHFTISHKTQTEEKMNTIHAIVRYCVSRFDRNHGEKTTAPLETALAIPMEKLNWSMAALIYSNMFNAFYLHQQKFTVLHHCQRMKSQKLSNTNALSYADCGW